MSMALETDVPVIEETGPAVEVEVDDTGVVTDDETPAVEETPENEGGEPSGTEHEGAPPDKEAEAAAAKEKQRTEEEDETLYERDGRKVDNKTRRMIADLKKTNPTAAKVLADNYFHRDAYQKEFPTVQAAREARAIMESLGGTEGIGKLQEEVTDYRAEIDQFSRGDRGLIEQLYEGNPEAVVTAAQNSLDILREKNPNAFQLAMLPSFVELLDTVQLNGLSATFPQVLDRLLQDVFDGKGQEAWERLSLLKQWYSGVKGNLTKQRDTKTRIDPERQKLQEDRKKFDQETATARETQALNDINLTNNKILARTVEPLFNEMNLKIGGRKAFVKELQERVWAGMKEDKQFIAVANSIKATGDQKRYVEYVAGKFAELLPDHFEETRNDLYPNYKPRKAGEPPPKNGQQPNTNGKQTPAPAAKQGTVTWRVVHEAPKPDTVDFSRTTDPMIVKGFYILKDKSRIKVK